MVSVPVPEEGWLNQMSLVMSVCEQGVAEGVRRTVGRCARGVDVE